MLRSGYGLEATEGTGADHLSITAPDGRICLKIVLLPDGPLVEMQSVSLSIAARDALTLECDRLDIHARQEIILRSDGDLSQQAGGDLRLRAEGLLETEAHTQHLRARWGDIQVTANDDVLLDGERIRLNSPRTGHELVTQKKVQ